MKTTLFLMMVMILLTGCSAGSDETSGKGKVADDDTVATDDAADDVVDDDTSDDDATTTTTTMVTTTSTSTTTVLPTTTTMVTTTSMVTTTTIDVEISCPWGMFSDDQGADANLCPPNFIYFEGGDFLVRRTGQRWGFYGETSYFVNIKPFCLSVYEVSQPTADADHQGDWIFGQPIPPAQVRAGVVPWGGLSPKNVQLSAQQQIGTGLPECQQTNPSMKCRYRPPTFEELQYVVMTGDPMNVWIWGGTAWDCQQSEKSWFETCAGQREVNALSLTGGPTGESDYGLGVFDLLGGVSEWTQTPWDMGCYGSQRFSIFGAATAGNHGTNNFNHPDPDKLGCWRMELYGGGSAYPEHEHDWLAGPNDDGGRVAAEPGSQWRDFVPRTEPIPGFVPEPVAWYYAIDYTGDYGRICYSLPTE